MRRRDMLQGVINIGLSVNVCKSVRLRALLHKGKLERIMKSNNYLQCMVSFDSALHVKIVNLLMKTRETNEPECRSRNVNGYKGKQDQL